MSIDTILSSRTNMIKTRNIVFNSSILDDPLLIQCNVTLIFYFKCPDPEPPKTVTKVKKELFTPEKESPPKDIVKQEKPDTPPEVIRDSIPASLPTVFVMNTAKQVCLNFHQYSV